MHCLQVRRYPKPHPTLYVSTELKYLRGTGIGSQRECVFVVLPVKTEIAFQSDL